MEQDEQVKYTAFVKFETTDKAEYDRFVEGALKIGGIPLSSHTVIEQVHVPGPYEVNRDDFDEILDRRGVSEAWKTRYWRALADIQSSKEFPELAYRQRPQVNYIDFRFIRERLEEAEKGAIMPSGIGQKIWNILSDTIRERFPEDPEIKPLLHWDPEIHPRLEGLRTGQNAVAKLVGRYALEL